MSFRTRIWGKIGLQAKQDADSRFSKLPKFRPAKPVGLVPLERAWGIPGTSVTIADDLPVSVLPIKDRVLQTALKFLLWLLPPNEAKTRWDAQTADNHLLDILGGKGELELWDDWQTDAGWARTFTQGPNASDLRREGDVWVIDASALGEVDVQEGQANLGVVIAFHIDEEGPRPAWIKRHDGTVVRPSDAN